MKFAASVAHLNSHKFISKCFDGLRFCLNLILFPLLDAVIFCHFVTLHHFSSDTADLFCLLLKSESVSQEGKGHVSIILFSQAFTEKAQQSFQSIGTVFVENVGCQKSPLFSRSVQPELTYLIRMGAHWAHRDPIEGLWDETTAESVKLVFQLRVSAELTDDFIYFHFLPEHMDSSEVVHVLLQCSSEWMLLWYSHLFVCKHL